MAHKLPVQAIAINGVSNQNFGEAGRHQRHRRRENVSDSSYCKNETPSVIALRTCGGSGGPTMAGSTADIKKGRQLMTCRSAAVTNTGVEKSCSSTPMRRSTISARTSLDILKCQQRLNLGNRSSSHEVKANLMRFRVSSTEVVLHKKILMSLESVGRRGFSCEIKELRKFRQAYLCETP